MSLICCVATGQNEAATDHATALLHHVASRNKATCNTIYAELAQITFREDVSLARAHAGESHPPMGDE